ncbi:caffeic acid 3-O-methyltransferase-like [Pistacia vera]|uniref:caffeic acid 3-O-methyltransferase-like n=1 Tax=Pistacia vera TaxID=55513 RepID=UPI00126331D7|nr:caffeic acid 3-O-methyltransferase-like [Pistacia vera]
MGSIDNKETLSINKANEVFVDAMLFYNSIVFPMVLKAAIELNLFKIIAKADPGAHISASKVASQLPSNSPSTPSMLDRVLYFLASHSMLSDSLRTLEDSRIEKLYALTAASQLFVNNNDELMR